MATFNFKSRNDIAFYKAFRQALGGSKYIESTQDTKFGKWSPNAIRDVLIGDGTIAVRWFEGAAPADLPEDAKNWTVSRYSEVPDSSDVITRVLSSKRFANIETLFVQDGLNFNLDSFYNHQTGNGSQTTVVNGVEVEDNSTNSGWGNIHGIGGNVRLREVGILSEPFASAMKALISGSRMPICSNSKVYNSDTDYVNAFSLNSTQYPIDSKGGALNEFLIKRQAKKDDTPESSPAVDEPSDEVSEDDSDTSQASSNADVESDAKFADLRERAAGIYASEDTDENHKPILAYLLTPDIRISKANLDKSVALPYANDLKTYQQVGSALGTKSTTEGSGYYGLTDGKVAVTVLKAAKGLGIDIPMKGTTREVYTSLLDAMEKTESPEDKMKESVLEIYGSRIGGLVNNIITEYDRIFSAGYELSKPEAILAGEQEQFGVVQGGSVQVKHDNRTPEYRWLWRSLAPALGIITVSPSIDLDEIAKSESGSYFPELMARIAYGYKPTSHGGKVEGSWDSYKKEYLRPTLIDLVTRLYVSALMAADKTTEDEIAGDGYSVIEHVADALTESLMRVMMVSDFKSVGSGSERKLVSATVKLLMPADQDADEITNAIKAAFGRSIADPTLSSAKIMTTVSDSGHYLESIVVLDSDLDNATPVFAYKALEALAKNGVDLKSLNLYNAVLGIDNHGHILRAGDKVNFENYVVHCILARSRAGKGVMTMALLLYSLLNGSLLGYGDDKPDIASLLKYIYPGAFVVNGSNITSDPAGGNDIFGSFANGVADSWINSANIPDYLVKDHIISGISYEALGDFFYMRYITLVMGMIAVRTLGPKYRGMLGGDAGITAVFDEFKNFSDSLAGKFSTFAKNGNVAGTKDARNVAADRSKGKLSEEDILSSHNSKPGYYWVAIYLQKLKESADHIDSLRNAGGNDEKKINNVFLLGQNKVLVDHSFDGTLQPANSGSRASVSTDDIKGLLMGMITLGGQDAFVGYSERADNFLLQYDQSTKYASNLLTSKARNFAYVGGLGAKSANLYADGPLGKHDEKVAFSDSRQYFKPFLVLEDSGMDSYPVRELLSVIETAIPGKSKEVIEQNSDDGGKTFSDGVSFLGYLERAGMSKEALTQKLQADAASATQFVQMLGYEGTWQDFVFDLRPEWAFSTRDIRNAFDRGMTSGDDSQIAETFRSASRMSQPMIDMSKVFPKIVPALAALAAGIGANDYASDLPTSSQFGQSFEDGDASFASDNPDAEYSDEIPPATDPDEDVDDSAADDAVVPGADADASEMVEYLTSQVIAHSRGKDIIVKGNSVTAGGSDIGSDQTSTPQTYLNWESILRRGQATHMEMSSEYARSYVQPAVGWKNAGAKSFFKESTYLRSVVLDGHEYLRENMVSEPVADTQSMPIVQPQKQMPPMIPVSNAAEEEVAKPSRKQEMRESGQQGTLSKLLSRGGDKVKNSWHNGGVVRKAAGIGLVAAGANVISGGMVVSGATLVGSLLAPFALPLAGIGTGIYLLARKHRK